MSWTPAEEPGRGTTCTSVAAVVVPRAKDLGGFEVRRVLPSAAQRAVGPFVFFDHLGPAEFAPGTGIDVRPHPHIGLETVTYLFEGSLFHRDSLGSVQPILPGAVNWMTAGRGIVHSERTDDEPRRRGHRIHAIQSWVALPREREEVAPAFVHHPATDLPVVEAGGARVILIAGSLLGRTSPVVTQSPLFYADVALEGTARLDVAPEHAERAAYVAAGTIEVSETAYEAGHMLVLEPDRTVTLAARTPARVMLLGGAPLDGRRRVWWNFVSSRPERIEQAKDDWRDGRFADVPGEIERIPLPDDA